MGKNQVRFACHHCGHCCTDVICFPTPWDVIGIVRETGNNPYQFLEFIRPDEVDGVTKNDPTWLKVNGEKYMMALKRDQNGCYFFDVKSRMCQIYTARPLLCRLYPFKLHESRLGEFKGFSLHTDVGCPKHRDGSVNTAPLYTLFKEDQTHQEDYRNLVSAFNRREYEGKKPEDFIEMFVVYRKNNTG